MSQTTDKEPEAEISQQLSEGWNHLSAALVGMSIKDPRWKPAVAWLNKNRAHQKPIPRLPKQDYGS